MTERHGHQQFIPGIELWTSNPDELISYIENRVKSGKATMIITLNPLMVLEQKANPQFAKILEEADVIVADGIGVRWAARRIARIDPPLIPGVELADKLTKLASKNALPVILVGAKPGVWEKAKEQLSKDYSGLNVVDGCHGYLTESEAGELIDRLASHNALLVIAGMGFPKQEIFLYKYKERFPGAILIGVGGSLDIYAGIKKRAPTFFRKTGTEWLWRMVTEPKRFKNIPKLLKFWFWVQTGHR